MGFMKKIFTGKKSDKASSKSNGKGGNTKTKEGRKSERSSTDNMTVVTSSSSASFKQRKERKPKTNEDIITEYMATINRHGSVEELVDYFTSPDAPQVFEDGVVMPAAALMAEIRKVYLGFEDLRFNYDSIKEVKPGQVLLEDLCVTGTHTKDFAFANFPAIPPTGRHVVLDQERLWFTMKDGKIEKQEITALGNLTGPPGMYVSVGGKLEMPPSEG
ncbi:expressed unknown protein [Seminavis robusta]|uniref:SnoaL-like domain-containing protein n=1 Tax=Seminavis robusta TaxID=568900 RepID=A0A9N8DN65_9STRA|nr:expressed unknown protein [Seminavis robusta]|eukprot:Sro148_g068180.1 n/a (217) ;mRNA; f:67639-68289